MLNQNNIEVLISEKEIKSRIKELAYEILKQNINKQELVLITVLQGGKNFTYHLIDEIRSFSDIAILNYFIHVSSYKDQTESSGKLDVIRDLDGDIIGKHVFIIEDIIDSGFTLQFLKKYLAREKKAQSIKIAVLLNKPSRRKCNVHVDCIGFEIPDEFVVGCGLDYKGDYRDLDYVGVIQ